MFYRHLSNKNVIIIMIDNLLVINQVLSNISSFLQPCKIIVLILFCDFGTMQKTVNLIIRNKDTIVLRTMALDTI